MKMQRHQADGYQIEAEGQVIHSATTYAKAREWAEINAPGGWVMYKIGVQSKLNKSSIGTHWKIDPEQWSRIRKMSENGVRMGEIADMYGVTKQTIMNIKKMTG